MIEGGFRWREWILRQIDENMYDLFVIAATAVAAIVRASGITVDDGQTGLKFSFGRATRTLAPGFHPLFPFLQTARVVPTRSRTLELTPQRVETREGLVFFADANLVYKVVDVRRALIEIDDLTRGMLQMLGIGVQEVLRAAPRDQIAKPRSLDQALAENLALRLEPWGVVVERAGFKSITPDRATLRITQLENVARERRAVVDLVAAEGHPAWRSIALAGTRVSIEPRTRQLRSAARRSRRIRLLRGALVKRGWTNVQIKQAGLSLRSRITTGGVLSAPESTRPARSAAALGKARAAAKEKSAPRARKP